MSTIFRQNININSFFEIISFGKTFQCFVFNVKSIYYFTDLSTLAKNIKIVLTQLLKIIDKSFCFLYNVQKNKGRFMLNEIVSKRLKELRNGIKISQAKLAPKLGVAQSLIARYETGEHMPPVEFLVKVADYYDVSLDFLVGRANSPQGKLYKYQAKTIKDDKMREFVEMCFDPNSPTNAKLKEAVIKLLKKQEQ